MVSNTVTLTLFGPVIDQLVPSRSPVVAGSGQVDLVVKGQNFRNDASLRIGNASLDSSHLKVVNRGLIKAVIPASIVDTAGTLSVVVVNGDGSASNSVNLDSLAPGITAVEPGQIIAGPADSRVAITGTNFRRHLGVKVGKTGDNQRSVPVHFVSDSRLVVVLNGTLVSQPGSLTFQVVNPGKGAGIPSTTKDVQLVGPNITDAQLGSVSAKTPDVTLTITGSSFAPGARVQFLKDGQIELERTPDKIKESKITLDVRASKLIGLGDYNVRVVNPGEIPSNQFQPRN